MDRDRPAFRYFSEKFHTLSGAKIKEGIFIGPQIRELLKNIQFDSIITGNEKAAWGVISVMHQLLYMYNVNCGFLEN